MNKKQRLIETYEKTIVMKLGHEHPATIQFFEYTQCLNQIIDYVPYINLNTMIISYFNGLMKMVKKNESEEK